LGGEVCNKGGAGPETGVWTEHVMVHHPGGVETNTPTGEGRKIDVSEVE